MSTLQTKCREWGLGGKDNKDNLRAKLLRKVRQELGLPVFGPDNVQPGSVRLPQVRPGVGGSGCCGMLMCRCCLVSEAARVASACDCARLAVQQLQRHHASGPQLASDTHLPACVPQDMTPEELRHLFDSRCAAAACWLASWRQACS